MSTDQRATAATPEDRRRAARRQPTLGTVCLLEAGSDQPAKTALVWNISLGGVSILFHKPVEPGAWIGGELTTMNHGAALSVKLRITHVMPLRTGDYFLGCQFEQPLTGDQMQPFVAKASA